MRQAPVESWLSRLLARMLANSALAGAKTRKFRTRLGWQLDFSRAMKVLAYIIGPKTDFCRWSELDNYVILLAEAALSRANEVGVLLFP